MSLLLNSSSIAVFSDAPHKGDKVQLAHKNDEEIHQQNNKNNNENTPKEDATNASNAHNSDLDPVSHHATYKVEFSCDPSVESDYAKATGIMTLELVRYEDNWIMKQTSSLRMSAPGGDEDDVETTSTALNSVEHISGNNYRFTAQAMREGVIEEEIVGNGRLAGEDAAGTVVYDKPEILTISLPERSVFPLKHLRMLMEKAKSITSKSIQLLECKVFDGSSDIRDALRIDAVIASVDPKAKTIELTHPELVGPHKLYRAEMSVFTLNNKTSYPDYKIIQIFSDQGIIFKIIVDYGDYKITSKLTELNIFTEANAQSVLTMNQNKISNSISDKPSFNETAAPVA